jgi:hypothetical protein
MQQPLLEDIMQYENENIVYKFIENFSITYEEAMDIFNEMKKMLYCCYDLRMRRGKGEVDFIFKIYDPMLIIDEMWHTFILFTKDYTDFCNKYFGYYLHHNPTSYKEKQDSEENFKKDKILFTTSIRRELEEQFSYIYDILGKDTVTKWYELYPEKYSREAIGTLLKKY